MKTKKNWKSKTVPKVLKGTLRQISRKYIVKPTPITAVELERACNKALSVPDE